MCVHLLTETACKRYLSISSSPTEKGHIEFTKKITESDFSKALNSLKAGDSLKAEYPFGNFTLKEPDDLIAFLSGGIGITPIRSICKFVVDKKPGVDIVLIYGNRSIRDIVFRDDFEIMQSQYSKLKVHHVLQEEAPDFKCRIGLINAQAIKEEIPDYLDRIFYLCGPPGMVAAMNEILIDELSLMKEKIITENFTGY